MTIEEFYKICDGDYVLAKNTFANDERIYKYLIKFTNDPSFKRLSDGVAAGDVSEAFEGAHALKGVSSMFHLNGLYNAVYNLVEQIRGLKAPVDMELFNEVQQQYDKVIENIAKISAE